MTAHGGLVWEMTGTAGDCIIAVAGPSIAYRDTAGTWRTGHFPTTGAAHDEAVRITGRHQDLGMELRTGPVPFTTGPDHPIATAAAAAITTAGTPR